MHWLKHELSMLLSIRTLQCNIAILLSFLSPKSFWPYLVLNIANKSLNFKKNLDR